MNMKSTIRPIIMAASSSVELQQSAMKNTESLSSNRGKKLREFNFSLWNFRHVAFKIAYLGWSYNGLAIQESTNKTIEAKLFESLMQTKLIQDRSTCNYSRCGRTDKEVSALSQVVALNIRSNLLEGLGVIVKEGSQAHERKGDKSIEINYMHILNKVLPNDIRIIGYSPVHVDFSARFNCLQRIYKYFFPLGNMDIEIMREASKKFIGEHDFRNFCKMDIRGGVTNFRRSISNVTIQPLENTSESSPYDMYEITVTGKAFLQHQIRCMVAILFLIGNGLEKPELIDFMLDIVKCPGKPQYGMASGYPLILYQCIFEDIDWQVDQASYREVISQLQQIWSRKMIEATMINRMLESIQLPLLLSSSVVPKQQITSIISSDHKLGTSNYKPLHTRPTGDTFEERFEYHKSKRRRLEEQNDSID